MIDLKATYGKRYRVTWEESWQAGDIRPDREFYEIVGKRGYIRPWGESELEMYLTSMVLANRIERSYPQFVPKNRYDDAVAFVFSPADIGIACKWIKAKNRRQLTPEQLEKLRSTLSRINSKREKPQ